MTDIVKMLSLSGTVTSVTEATDRFRDLQPDDCIPHMKLSQLLHRISILLEDYSTNG